MLSRVAVAALLLAASAPAFAETGRFAPDNPWFQDFEADCRAAPMPDHCAAGIVMLYSVQVGAEPSQVKCDLEAFWRVRDAKKAEDPNDYLAVLPWEYGVEFIVSEPDVCSTQIGY